MQAPQQPQIKPERPMSDGGTDDDNNKDDGVFDDTESLQNESEKDANEDEPECPMSDDGTAYDDDTESLKNGTEKDANGDEKELHMPDEVTDDHKDKDDGQCDDAQSLKHETEKDANEDEKERPMSDEGTDDDKDKDDGQCDDAESLKHETEKDANENEPECPMSDEGTDDDKDKVDGLCDDIESLKNGTETDANEDEKEHPMSDEGTDDDEDKDDDLCDDTKLLKNENDANEDEKELPMPDEGETDDNKDKDDDLCDDIESLKNGTEKDANENEKKEEDADAKKQWTVVNLTPTFTVITVPPQSDLCLTLEIGKGKFSGAKIAKIHPPCPFRAHVSVGDRIVTINKRKVTTWEDIKAGKDKTRELGIVTAKGNAVKAVAEALRTHPSAPHDNYPYKYPPTLAHVPHLSSRRGRGRSHGKRKISYDDDYNGEVTDNSYFKLADYGEPKTKHQKDANYDNKTEVANTDTAEQSKVVHMSPFFIVVTVPPGKGLGLIIDSWAIITDIVSSCPFWGEISVGDRIVSVNGKEVRTSKDINVSKDQERKFHIAKGKRKGKNSGGMATVMDVMYPPPPHAAGAPPTGLPLHGPLPYPTHPPLQAYPVSGGNVEGRAAPPFPSYVHPYPSANHHNNHAGGVSSIIGPPAVPQHMAMMPNPTINSTRRATDGSDTSNSFPTLTAFGIATQHCPHAKKQRADLLSELLRYSEIVEGVGTLVRVEGGKYCKVDLGDSEIAYDGHQGEVDKEAWQRWRKQKPSMDEIPDGAPFYPTAAVGNENQHTFTGLPTQRTIITISDDGELNSAVAKATNNAALCTARDAIARKCFNTIKATNNAALCTARDAIARICFNTKMKNKSKRIPRGMMQNLVDKQNEKAKGLGLTVKMVSSVVDRMYRQAIASSDSDDMDGPESEHRENLIADITKEYITLKRKYGKKRIAKKVIDSIIAKKKQEYCVDPNDPYFEVNKQIIHQRGFRYNRAQEDDIPSTDSDDSVEF